MKPFKRAVGAAVASLALASSAFAADIAPLPAGKPAGTKQALLAGPGLLIGLGIAAVVIIAVVASNHDNDHVTTPTTGTTGTSS